MYKRRLLCPLVLCGLLAACGDADELDAVESDMGTLQVEWAINDNPNPALCIELTAEQFELIVLDDGFFVEEQTTPCEAFRTSLGLPAGDYTAEAALLSDLEEPMTGRIALDEFTILPGDITRIEVNFRADIDTF